MIGLCNRVELCDEPIATTINPDSGSLSAGKLPTHHMILRASEGHITSLPVHGEYCVHEKFLIVLSPTTSTP